MPRARGVTLLVEKPIALDMTAADAHGRGRRSERASSAAIGFMYRLGDAVRRWRELDTGRSGLYVGGYHCNALHADWWRDEAKSGGQILEQVIHQIDLIRHLMGEPDTVYARHANLFHRDIPDYDVEDLSSTIFGWDDGRIATLERLQHRYPRRLAQGMGDLGRANDRPLHQLERRRAHPRRKKKWRARRWRATRIRSLPNSVMLPKRSPRSASPLSRCAKARGRSGSRSPRFSRDAKGGSCGLRIEFGDEGLRLSCRGITLGQVEPVIDGIVPLRSYPEVGEDRLTWTLEAGGRYWRSSQARNCAFASGSRTFRTIGRSTASASVSELWKAFGATFATAIRAGTAASSSTRALLRGTDRQPRRRRSVSR